MPNHLQQIAAPAPEAEQMATQRIALQHLLHQKRQAGEALPHIGVAGGKPHPDPARQRDHRALPPDSAATAAVNVAGSTAPVIRSCTPLANAISIVPPVPARAAHAGDSGATETAANCTSLSCRGALTAPNEPVRACRRQTVGKLGCTSCRRATSTTLAEGAWLSSTIRSFSIVDHRRRRSGPDRTETLLTFAHLLANQSANYRRQSCRPEGGPHRRVTHSIARREVHALLEVLKLPIDDRGRRRAAARAEWFAARTQPLDTGDILAELPR
jgi:hypothetical protein